MDTNDLGESVVDLDCFCSNVHCYGNLSIQPDKIKGERVFMVSVTDSRGNGDGDMWLSPKQLEQLISELGVLLSTYGNE